MKSELRNEIEKRRDIIYNEVNESYYGLKQSESDLSFQEILTNALLKMENEEIDFEYDEFCKYFEFYFEKLDKNGKSDLDIDDFTNSVIKNYLTNVKISKYSDQLLDKYDHNLKLRKTNLANSSNLIKCHEIYKNNLKSLGIKDEIIKRVSKDLFENVDTNLSVDLVGESDNLSFYIEGLRNFVSFPIRKELDGKFVGVGYNSSDKENYKYNFDKKHEKELLKVYNSLYGVIDAKNLEEMINNFTYYTSGYYRIFKDSSNKTISDINNYILNRYSYKSIKKNGRILEKLDLLHNQLYNIFKVAALNITKNYNGCVEVDNNSGDILKEILSSNDPFNQLREYFEKEEKPHNLIDIIINHKLFQFYTLYSNILNDLYKECVKKGVTKLNNTVKIFDYDKALEKDMLNYGSVIISKVKGFYKAGINTEDNYKISEVEYVRDSKGKVIDINNITIEILNSLLSGKMDVDLFQNVRPYCNLTETYLINCHFGNQEPNIYKKLIEDLVESEEKYNPDIQWLRDILVANYKRAYNEDKLTQLEGLSKKYNLFLYELRSSPLYRPLLELDKANDIVYNKQIEVEANRLEEGIETYYTNMLVSPTNGYNRRVIMDNEPNMDRFLVLEGYNPVKRNTITMYLIVNTGVLYRKLLNTSLVYKITYRDVKSGTKVREFYDKNKDYPLEDEKRYSGIRANSSTNIEDYENYKKYENITIKVGNNYEIPYYPYKVIPGISEDNENIYGLYDIINLIELTYSNYLSRLIFDKSLGIDNYQLKIESNNDEFEINRLKSKKKEPIFKVNLDKTDLSWGEDQEFNYKLYKKELNYSESNINDYRIDEFLETDIYPELEVSNRVKSLFSWE